MIGETVDIDASKVEGGAAAKDKRVISTIEFPYNDIETGIAVARAVRNRNGAGPCSLAELAAEMDHELNSGTFRLKVTAARMFGLVTVDRAVVMLTDLGRQIIDGTPDERRAELSQAFLSVELYGALYKRYEGFTLPPAAALEREIVVLGVSEKQKEKARQAFDRSARYVGFIAANGRMIRPVGNHHVAAETPAQSIIDPGIVERGGFGNDKVRAVGSGGGGGGGDGPDGGRDDLELDPLIRGLLKRLPSAERNWPTRERARWLNALATNLAIIYAPDEEDEIEITVRTHTP